MPAVWFWFPLMDDASQKQEILISVQLLEKNYKKWKTDHQGTYHAAVLLRLFFLFKELSFAS